MYVCDNSSGSLQQQRKQKSNKSLAESGHVWQSVGDNESCVVGLKSSLVAFSLCRSPLSRKKRKQFRNQTKTKALNLNIYFRRDRLKTKKFDPRGASRLLLKAYKIVSVDE